MIKHGVRVVWFSVGIAATLVGVVGLFVPVLPTVPFLLIALMGFSKSCTRCERWLLDHPHFGPALREWRAHHAVPLHLKQYATVLMALSSVASWLVLDSPWRWIPGTCCAAVAWWLWSLPTAARPAFDEGRRRQDAGGDRRPPLP